MLRNSVLAADAARALGTKRVDEQGSRRGKKKIPPAKECSEGLRKSFWETLNAL